MKRSTEDALIYGLAVVALHVVAVFTIALIIVLCTGGPS